MPPDNRQALRATPHQNRLLGRLIGAHRVLRGIEPAALAAALGRSPAWVSRLEKGLIGISAFEYARIARVLRIPEGAIDQIAWRGTGLNPPPEE